MWLRGRKGSLRKHPSRCPCSGSARAITSIMLPRGCRAPLPKPSSPYPHHRSQRRDTHVGRKAYPARFCVCRGRFEDRRIRPSQRLGTETGEPEIVWCPRWTSFCSSCFPSCDTPRLAATPPKGKLTWCGALARQGHVTPRNVN